jgi:UDP-N-acetylglucosamine/UDP-N-acetylgalactosamine diphosphorylase
MTSESNYEETVKFFDKNKYFDLLKNQVYFFKQGFFPTLTNDGKLVLEAKDRLYKNPDGHGGVIKALLQNGLDKIMQINKIEYISYFQVDNPLINLADPYFIGYHIKTGSDITTKVIKKLYPDEKLGTIANDGTKNLVIEYSDMSEVDMMDKTSDGKIKYEMGSIGIHILTVKFMIKESDFLPVHYAKKQIDAYDFSAIVKSEIRKIDAIKFEKFIFDLIPMTKNSFFFETDRIDDFAPLKNKTGNDSIETAIKGQSDQFKLWLSEAKIMRNSENDKIKIEISPLFAPDKYIFIRKAVDLADKLKETCYISGGKLQNEIYIC